MSSVRMLRTFVDKYTKWRLRSSPEYATSVDVHNYNDMLEQQSVDAYDEKYQICCGMY